MKSEQPLSKKILNLACGDNKIDGAINVDINKDFEPDFIHDICTPFPWKDGEIDEVLLFHTIEHIVHTKHPTLLSEIHRVLKPEGVLFVSFPEFTKCAMNWINNHQGKRDFWRATIFGRQSTPWDFHCSLMDSEELKDLLRKVGFKNIESAPESSAFYYSVIRASKGEPMISYEEVLKVEIFGSMKMGDSLA